MVLEDTLSDLPSNNYYIFSEASHIEDEIKISLKDSLYSLVEEDFSHELWDFADMRGNHFYLKQVHIDGETISVIDLDSNTEVGVFNSYGDIVISADGKVLTGLQEPKVKVDKASICPEYVGTDSFDNYIITEEVEYTISTGETTKTGKLGCSYMQ